MGQVFGKGVAALGMQVIDYEKYIEDERLWFQCLSDQLALVAEYVAAYRDDEAAWMWAAMGLEEALTAAGVDRPGSNRGPVSAIERERRKVSPGRRKRVMERDEYRCRHCGDHRALVIDHIIALVNGGTSAEDNLQVLCGPCNSIKGVH